MSSVVWTPLVSLRNAASISVVVRGGNNDYATVIDWQRLKLRAVATDEARREKITRVMKQIDQDIRVFTSTGSIDASASDEAVGVNAHFGVDVGLSRKVSLFGVGRFDIVDDQSNSLDAKAYLGLRIRFGGGRPDHWDPDED